MYMCVCKYEEYHCLTVLLFNEIDLDNRLCVRYKNMDKLYTQQQKQKAGI